jgi:hypothetical protein
MVHWLPAEPTELDENESGGSSELKFPSVTRNIWQRGKNSQYQMFR